MATLSPTNEWIWQCLKLYLPPHTELTSVYRSGNDQLRLVVERAKGRGYKFSREPTLSDESSWYDAWKLVNSSTNPVAKPGRSMHQRGVAYDLAGPDLTKILDAVNDAADKGAIRLLPARPNWPNPRLEGRCVHVEIDSGRIDFVPWENA